MGRRSGGVMSACFNNLVNNLTLSKIYWLASMESAFHYEKVNQFSPIKKKT